MEREVKYVKIKIFVFKVYFSFINVLIQGGW